MRCRSSKGHRESGYALLLVYAMAATVAIMLYMQLPRVAFEAQRDREQLLIDRGEQYSRAIKLYVRKFNRFPADMDALDSTQNIRFLRRHYVDPMTGKSEWRLIHVGPGGVFTDSLLHKKPAADQFAAQNFITEMQQVGGNQNGNGEGVNLANRRRASDQPGAPGDPNIANNNSGQPNGPNTDPNAPPGSAPIQGPVMVLPNGQIVPASTSGYPPTTPQPGQAGTQQPGQPGYAGQPGQPGQSGSFPTQPGMPNGFQNQPNQPGVPPTAAASLINQLLTTPRAGGLNGIPGGQPGAPQGGMDQFGNPVQPQTGAGTGTSTATLGTPAGQGMGGAAIGGGLAGVASKLEQEGIKSYNDHTAYNEWEFVYDMTKDPARGAGAMPPAQAPPGTPVGGPNGTPSGTPTASPTSAQPGSPSGFTPPFTTAPTPGTN